MTALFFLPLSPTFWELIVAIIFLVFGANKLPELIKGFGQSKRGSTDNEGRADKPNEHISQKQTSLSAMDDEALLAETPKRLRPQEGTASETPIKGEKDNDKAD